MADRGKRVNEEKIQKAKAAETPVPWCSKREVDGRADRLKKAPERQWSLSTTKKTIINFPISMEKKETHKV